MENYINNILTNNSMVKSDSSVSKQIKIEQVPVPFIKKDIVLFAPGTHNRLIFTPETVKEIFENTNWEDEIVTSLFYDHVDTQAMTWAGRVLNPRIDEQGIVKGDVAVYDLNGIIKLMYGNPKWGVSARIDGPRRGRYVLGNSQFKNFSLVINPAVSYSYLHSKSELIENDKEVMKMSEEEIKQTNETNEKVETKSEPKSSESKEESKPKETPNIQPSKIDVNVNIDKKIDEIKETLSSDLKKELDEVVAAIKDIKQKSNTDNPVKKEDPSIKELKEKISKLEEALKKPKITETKPANVPTQERKAQKNDKDLDKAFADYLLEQIESNIY